MPNRDQEAGYRYGYQGEYAEEEELGGTHSFELRLWDARIGRWLSPDPYRQFNSPYLGMGNIPNMGVDPDGAWVKGAGFFRNIFNPDQKILAQDRAAVLQENYGNVEIYELKEDYQAYEKGTWAVRYQSGRTEQTTEFFTGESYHDRGSAGADGIVTFGGIIYEGATYGFTEIQDPNFDFAAYQAQLEAWKWSPAGGGLANHTFVGLQEAPYMLTGGGGVRVSTVLYGKFGQSKSRRFVKIFSSLSKRAHKEFNNLEGKLPQYNNGEPVTYKEYRYNRSPSPLQRANGATDGKRRVVVGSDGSAYYTNDHYSNFTPIIKP